MAEHIVGKTSDIDEGTGKTFTIEGQTIAVFNKSGEIFAIEDTCKHKGGSLGEGELDGDTITCPSHSSRRMPVKQNKTLFIFAF